MNLYGKYFQQVQYASRNENKTNRNATYCTFTSAKLFWSAISISMSIVLVHASERVINKGSLWGMFENKKHESVYISVNIYKCFHSEKIVSLGYSFLYKQLNITNYNMSVLLNYVFIIQ